MSSYSDVLNEARARGITLQIDAAGDLEIGGEYTDKFVGWVKRHKAELVAELNKPKDLNTLLDAARAGTGFSIKDCRTLFTPLDLEQIARGELSPEATRRFLEYQAGRICRRCLGGGCAQCDFYGTANADQVGARD